MIENLILGGVIALILTIISTGYFYIVYARKKRKLIRMHSISIRNKKRKRKLKKSIINERENKKRAGQLGTLSLLITVLLTIGVLWGSDYLSTTLDLNDSNTVVNTHYLLTEFDKQLSAASEGKDDENKIRTSIRFLGTKMASLGNKSASTSNSAEGQLILNRYYNSVKQIGMNASTQVTKFYGNPQLVSEFKEDIEAALSNEQLVFAHYKVDSKMLEE